jgi:hypothetical protein
MASRLLVSRALALVVATLGVSGVTVAIDGCGSDSTAPGDTSDAASAKETGTGEDGGTESDARTDSATTLPDAASVDASCPKGKVVASTGETCIGFGKGTPCDTACGLPAYGFVCFNGGPPGFAGCIQASSTGSFGETYCCPDNKCVPQPDQDKECKSAGTPHRYQCPPDGMGGSVAPPAGCADGGGGGSAVERFYCCP